MDTGPMYHVVCPFTPQFSLVLINRPRRDGTLSWRWYTATKVGIRTPATAKSGTVPLGYLINIFSKLSFGEIKTIFYYI